MTDRRTPQRLLATALAAAVLAGCSLTPELKRPEAPIPTQWPDAIGSAAQRGGPVASDLAWEGFFTDPTLRDLIQLALANNRDLRVAVLNIEQARAQFQIKRADLLPTVNAAATGSRTPTTSGGIASTYSAGLSVTAYEIDFFGRIGALKDQALAQYLATSEARKTTQISLVASVASGWLTLLADEDLLELTRQTLKTREESLRLMRLRFDNGAASELDLRQAESLLESARTTLAQQQRLRIQDENALALLLGTPLPAPAIQKLRPGLLAQVQLSDVPAGLPSDLLTRRPDVRQAEQQLVAANANIGAARAAFFPRIALTAGVGSASNQLSGLFKGGSWGFTLQPQLTVPIFDYGRNQANLESAQAGRDIAIAQYEKAIQTAFREVSDALAGRATWSEQLQAQVAQQQAEARRTELSQLRYQTGVASHLDLLDAQRSLFTAQQSTVTTRLAALQNQVSVYKVLGGGWSDSAPQENALR